MNETARAVERCARFFFTVTLDRTDAVKHLTFVAEPRKIRVVLNPEEAVRFLEAAPGGKYKAAPSVAYGAGLRASEVATLKVSDIDSERIMLRVDAMGCEHVGREVAQIDGDDDAGAAVDCGGEEPVQIILVGEERRGNRAKVMPADSFVAPKTTAGFDTYASEAVSLFRRRGNTPVGLLKRHYGNWLGAQRPARTSATITCPAYRGGGNRRPRREAPCRRNISSSAISPPALPNTRRPGRSTRAAGSAPSYPMI